MDTRIYAFDKQNKLMIWQEEKGISHVSVKLYDDWIIGHIPILKSRLPAMHYIGVGELDDNMLEHARLIWEGTECPIWRLPLGDVLRKVDKNIFKCPDKTIVFFYPVRSTTALNEV